MANRTHAEIIAAGDRKTTGVAAFANAISVTRNRVYPWERTDSIPAPYWSAVVDAGLATLEELANAAALRRPETQAAA